MADDFVSRLADRFPLLDGSGRRRFVAGALVLLGLAVPRWQSISAQMNIGVSELLGSPFLIVGLALLVYLLGTITEMLGSLVLIPVAAFVFRLVRPLLAVSDDPRFIESLWKPAQAVYTSFPEPVRSGIEHPASYRMEVAAQFVSQNLSRSINRQWARRSFARVADVGTLTTALIFVSVSVVLSWFSAPRLESSYWTALTDLQQKLDVHLQHLATIETAYDGLEKVLYDRGDLGMLRSLPSLRRHDVSRARDVEGEIAAFEAYISQRNAGMSITYWPSQFLYTIADAFKNVRHGVIEVATNEVTNRAKEQDIPVKGNLLILRQLLRNEEELWSKVEKAFQTLVEIAAPVNASRVSRKTALIILGSSFPVFLCFYAAYFLSLRRVFINCIEARAIELAEPVRNAGSQADAHDEAATD